MADTVCTIFRAPESESTGRTIRGRTAQRMVSGSHARIQLVMLETLRAASCEGRWRRDRDSNPGDGFPPTHFPGVRLRPLGHLSAGSPSLPFVQTKYKGIIWVKRRYGNQARNWKIAKMPRRLEPNSPGRSKDIPACSSRTDSTFGWPTNGGSSVATCRTITFRPDAVTQVSRPTISSALIRDQRRLPSRYLTCGAPGASRPTFSTVLYVPATPLPGP